MHLNTTKRSPHLLFPVHSSLQYSAVVLKFVSSSSSTDSPQHQPASQSVNTRHIPTLSHSNKIEQQNSSRSSISLGERRNCLVSCLCLCLCHLSFTSHQPSDTSDTHTATDSLVSLVADNSIIIIIIIGRLFVCLPSASSSSYSLTLFSVLVFQCVVWCGVFCCGLHFTFALFYFSFTVHHHHHRRRCLPGTSTISNRAVALALSFSRLLFTCALIIIILLHQHPPNRVCKNGSHQSLCTSCALSRKLLNVLPSPPPPLPTAISA